VENGGSGREARYGAHGGGTAAAQAAAAVIAGAQITGGSGNAQGRRQAPRGTQAGRRAQRTARVAHRACRASAVATVKCLMAAGMNPAASSKSRQSGVEATPTERPRRERSKEEFPIPWRTEEGSEGTRGSAAKAKAVYVW